MRLDEDIFMTSDADKKLRRKNRLYLIGLLIFLTFLFGIGKLPVEKNKDSQTGHEMFYLNVAEDSLPLQEGDECHVHRIYASN